MLTMQQELESVRADSSEDAVEEEDKLSGDVI